MKAKRKTYYPLLFVFCILFSTALVAVQNINSASHEKTGNIYKKYVEQESQKATNNDLLFEEKEVETEAEFDHKLLISSLPNILSFFQSNRTQNNPNIVVSASKINGKSIFLSVQNFRI